MPPSLIGKFSQRLRALRRRGGDATLSYEAEIATTGLIERVYDECRVRNNRSIDQRFGLVALLNTLATDGNGASPNNPGKTGLQADGSTGTGQGSGALRTFDADFQKRRRYDLADLVIDTSDAAFLELAYRCVLKRAPDPTGSRQLLTAMQAGTLDRVEVLHALNASFEGRSSGIVIVGLRWQWLLRRTERVPFLGFSIGWLRAIISARTLQRRLDALEARVEARYEQQAALETTRGQTNATVAALADRVLRFAGESRMQASTATAQARDSAERLQHLEDLLTRQFALVDELRAAIEDLATQAREHNLPEDHE